MTKTYVIADPTELVWGYRVDDKGRNWVQAERWSWYA